MSLVVQVKGGTGAGRRSVATLPDWTCDCPKTHFGSRYSCIRCGARRDAR